MKVDELTSVIKLINKISNPASLTSLYRSVEIGPISVRAVSEFGNIRILLSGPTGLESSVILDSESVQAITSSLPQGSDIILKENVNHVAWDCPAAQAKGKLNFVVQDHKIPEIVHDEFTWTPPPEFPTAIALAQHACQAAAVSFGLYGVTLEPIDGKLQMMSCNMISLACTRVDRGSYPDKKITIRPPVPAIIASLLTACPGCMVDIADDGIYIIGDWLMAHLPLGVNLDQDLKLLVDKFTTSDVVIPIDSSAVRKFISRVKSLTEKNIAFIVSMKVEEGKLILEHRGVASSSEQFFLAEGLDSTVSYASVNLDAEMLTGCLLSLQSIVCDYLPSQNLVLKGNNPEFLYVVGGHDVQ